jgi:hypothetical protein
MLIHPISRCVRLSNEYTDAVCGTTSAVAGMIREVVSPDLVASADRHRDQWRAVNREVRAASRAWVSVSYPPKCLGRHNLNTTASAESHEAGPTSPDISGSKPALA